MLLLIMCLPWLSPAQENSGSDLPALWSLQQCIDYAQKNNIQINSSRLTESVSEQNLIQSKSAMQPDLSVSASAGVANNDGVTERSSNLSLTSGLTLINGQYYRNDSKVKALDLEVSKLNVDTQENDIGLQLARAYLNILLANEDISYLREVVGTTEAQVIQAEQKNRLGSLANKDLMQLQASLASDRYNLTTALNIKRQDLLDLKQILQLPPDFGLEVVIPDTIRPSLVIPPLEEVQKKAVSVMPEIAGSKAGLEIQDLEIKKAKSGYYPALNLSGSLSVYGQNNTYYSSLDRSFTQQIGLSLSIPLSNRKITSTNVARARIQKSQQELNLQGDILSLNQKVEQAYISLVNAKSQLTSAEEQLRYTKELYRIANEELKIGLFNNVEYLQQKEQYLKALQEVTQAKYSAILYQMIYSFYNGMPISL
jgi:outer membrane protein